MKTALVFFGAIALCCFLGVKGKPTNTAGSGAQPAVVKPTKAPALTTASFNQTTVGRIPLKNDNKGVYRRSMIYVAVLLVICLAYFGFRSWRSGRRKQRYRRYGNGSRGDKIEMAHLESHPEEDSS